jgi:cytidylate kinase
MPPLQSSRIVDQLGAHAAGMSLAGMPGLLRVLVTAPLEVRVQRVAAERQVEPGVARKAVEHADAERRRYLQSFVHVGEEQPTHYDLVLSTEVFTPEQGAAIIVAAAG